jgi:hypothetical protein
MLDVLSLRHVPPSGMMVQNVYFEPLKLQGPCKFSWARKLLQTRDFELPSFHLRLTRRPGHGTCDGAFEAMLTVSRLVVACWDDGEHVHMGHRLGLLIGIPMDIGSCHLCLCMYKLPDLCSQDYVLRKFTSTCKLTITTNRPTSWYALVNNVLLRK